MLTIKQITDNTDAVIRGLERSTSKCQRNNRASAGNEQ